MALPKRKHSKARTARGRSHHALKTVNTIKCGSCGAEKLPHRACGECGKYKTKS